MKKNLLLIIFLIPNFLIAQNVSNESPAYYKFGGIPGLKTFIISKFKIKIPPYKSDVGRIFVDFVITEKGNIDSIEVWNDINKYMSSEIVRVLELTDGDWIPANDGEKAIKYKFVFFHVLSYFGEEKDLDKLYIESKEKAKRFYSKGKIKNAIKEINKCINYDPLNPEDFELRAKYKKEIGDIEGFELDKQKGERLQNFVKELGMKPLLKLK